MSHTSDLKEIVREKSGEAATSVQTGDGDAVANEVDGKFASAFIRATKPEGCCAPGCCSR